MLWHFPHTKQQPPDNDDDDDNNDADDGKDNDIKSAPSYLEIVNQQFI